MKGRSRRLGSAAAAAAFAGAVAAACALAGRRDGGRTALMYGHVELPEEAFSFKKESGEPQCAEGVCAFRDEVFTVDGWDQLCLAHCGEIDAMLRDASKGQREGVALAQRGRGVARGQQLFSVRERSPPAHGTGANDDPFLNLNPPLNPAISGDGHYGEFDAYSDHDPPVYKQSAGLAMLRAARQVQLAKETHPDPLPGFVPTYKVGGDPLPGFIPTFKAAQRVRAAVRQGLEWDGGSEWEGGSAAWAQSNTPSPAFDAWGRTLRVAGGPHEVPRWLRRGLKPEDGPKGKGDLRGRWSEWASVPSQTFIPGRLAQDEASR